MPFIGKDWRSTGDTWVKVEHTSGWEQVKLRPIQVPHISHPTRTSLKNNGIKLGSYHGSASGATLSEMIGSKTGDGAESIAPSSLPTDSKLDVENLCPLIGDRSHRSSVKGEGLRRGGISSSASIDLMFGDVGTMHEEDVEEGTSDAEDSGHSLSNSPHEHGIHMQAGPTIVASKAVPIKNSTTSDECEAVSCPKGSVESDEEKWIPYCYVKTTRSKEFIGCTSMSEAFHRLDLARAVGDVRRFNYICKVVQILVHEKLKNISATARKHLFAIIQSIVINNVEQDIHVSVAKDLLSRFSAGLEEGHVCGSPSLVNRQLGVASNLMDMIVQERKPTTLADSSEDSMTFLDLPREVISLILCRLPDHTSLLEVAKAHETFEALIEKESRMWRGLCQFHFTQCQIDRHQQGDPHSGWRHTFFELKKFYGLREIYADLIHICCHCKALFWKDHGHPCVGKEPPSVRVMPQQFVDMLLFL